MIRVWYQRFLKKKLKRNIGIIRAFDKRMETPLARKMQVRAVVAKDFDVSEATVTAIVNNRERWFAAEAQLKLAADGTD